MNHVVLSPRAQLIYEWIQGTLSPCGRGQGEVCEVVSPRNPLPILQRQNLPLPQVGEGGYEGFPLRQQTLAELFGCSRRTIGRCLTELKAAGLLTDTGKRENRVKVYQIIPSPLAGEVGLAAPKPGEGSKAQDHEPLTLTLSHKGRGNLSSEQPRYITLEHTAGKPPPPLRLLPGEVLNPLAADYWRHYHHLFEPNLPMYDGKNGRPLVTDIYASVTKDVRGSWSNSQQLHQDIFKALRTTPYYWSCQFEHALEQTSPAIYVHEPRDLSFEQYSHVLKTVKAANHVKLYTGDLELYVSTE